MKLKSRLLATVAVAAMMFSVTGCEDMSKYPEPEFDKIIVLGSTSVQPYMEILAEEYKYATGNIVNVQGGGSSAGITSATNGTCDLGMSSRALKESEEVEYIVIAKDGLAVIVNPDNPISGLSLEQIRKIYTGEFTNWKQLGGDDEPINAITREAGSGTRDGFSEAVMDGEKINAKFNTQNNNGAIKTLVARNKGAVGYVSLGAADETVKRLDIDGVAATEENVKAKKYGLFREFLVVFSDELNEASQNFLDYILSPAAQAELTKEGLISVVD